MLKRVKKRFKDMCSYAKKTCRVFKRNEFNNMLWLPLYVLTNRQTGQEHIQFNYKIPHPSM